MRESTLPSPDVRADLTQRLFDVFLVLATLAANAGGVLATGAHGGSSEVPGPLGLLLLAAGPALLWWRRRFPAPVLAGCVAATWGYVIAGFPEGPVYVPLIVALVSALTRGARAAAYAVVAGTVAVRLVLAALPGDGGPSLTSTTGLAAWLAFLVALGELLRHRRALAEARHQRLLMSLDAQADQIRWEAAEQRLSLAADLHDVLGHQLTLINVQAKAGRQLHDSGQPGVAEALDAVQEASSQALDDVQAFLDGLRRPDEHAPRAPSPSLGDLDGLLAPARAAGLDVRLQVTGAQRRLPAPHDLVAGRIVLESLTNVLRHAGLPRTWLRLDYAPARVTVRIDNAVPDRPANLEPPGGGRGLEGMRRRLAAHGGTLTAGPTGEHAWSVVAVLPVPEEVE